LPSQLKYWKEDANGKEIPSSGGLVPFDDVGIGSVNSAAEEERLLKLGYKTKIIRLEREDTREGGVMLQ
jgi:hypothetical protein